MVFLTDVIVRYYEASIKALLQSLDVPIEQLHFRMGSHYQLARYGTNTVELRLYVGNFCFLG